jgi:hypothetical protein
MSTEISTVQPRGLALDTFEDAFRFSKLVATSDFAPKDFRGKPESCLLAIQHGAELGLSPMQSLHAIAVVNGRPSVYGDTAAAVCMASAICEYIRETISGEGEQMVATCIAKRRGNAEPTTVSFSVADAKKAGLWGKQGPWTQYPRRMLQMRARGFALRDAFPDVLRGLVTAEEAADYTHVEPEPVRVTQPTPTPRWLTTPRCRRHVLPLILPRTRNRCGSLPQSCVSESMTASTQRTRRPSCSRCSMSGCL